MGDYTAWRVTIIIVFTLLVFASMSNTLGKADYVNFYVYYANCLFVIRLCLGMIVVALAVPDKWFDKIVGLKK